MSLSRCNKEHDKAQLIRTTYVRLTDRDRHLSILEWRKRDQVAAQRMADKSEIPESGSSQGTQCATRTVSLCLVRCSNYWEAAAMSKGHSSLVRVHVLSGL